MGYLPPYLLIAKSDMLVELEVSYILFYKICLVLICRVCDFPIMGFYHVEYIIEVLCCCQL